MNLLPGPSLLPGGDALAGLGPKPDADIAGLRDLASQLDAIAAEVAMAPAAYTAAATTMHFIGPGGSRYRRQLREAARAAGDAASKFSAAADSARRDANRAEQALNAWYRERRRLLELDAARREAAANGQCVR